MAAAWSGMLLFDTAVFVLVLLKRIQYKGSILPSSVLQMLLRDGKHKITDHSPLPADCDPRDFVLCVLGLAGAVQHLYLLCG